ncbi:MAG: C69 family dipeptidase [Solobacterium sp.]|nr:C69 family dipeptidase [Solobacterium sp.]MBR3126690.1 C69 family dipeptidase [Solobacterium sp.]
MNIYHNYKGMERGGCSTVIIGKAVSSTGHVIMGHNEDDEECVAQCHLVPRLTHAPGEMVTFEDGTAVIPQVEETLAFYWTDVKCEGGISFADCFVNECGVAVVTDSCRPSRDAAGAKKDNRKDYALGYALRRLIAERAHTAREGMELAAKLVEKYGYCSSRTYHIADKDEAWCLAIPKGFRCVARRVKDDEIYYIPNHYIIHEIDFSDPENWYWSEDLITFAIDQGWYHPAKEGDYSDFDFAAVYQEEDGLPRNLGRPVDAWKKLAGLELKPGETRITALKTDRKYTPEEVKAILRSHGEGTDYDMTKDGTITPHRGQDAYSICNNVTVESTVFVFADDLNLLKMYRASPKPCCAPYTPWYPLALKEIPAGYEWTPAKEALYSHFRFDPKEMQYNRRYAWWTFRNVQLLLDYNYPVTHREISASIAMLEAKWQSEEKAVEAAYAALRETDPEAAKDYLSDYTIQQAYKARQWADAMMNHFADDLWREKLYDNL